MKQNLSIQEVNEWASDGDADDEISATTEAITPTKNSSDLFGAMENICVILMYILLAMQKKKKNSKPSSQMFQFYEWQWNTKQEIFFTKYAFFSKESEFILDTHYWKMT